MKIRIVQVIISIPGTVLETLCKKRRIVKPTMYSNYPANDITKSS